MSAPIAERALREVFCRLKKIRKADGYRTDAGLNVFRARRMIAISDCPAVVIWDQGETIANGDGTSDHYRVTLSITVDGHVQCDTDDAGHMIECLKADVKRAVLSGSKGALAEGPEKSDLIGSIAITGCQVTEREEGSKTESMSIAFDIWYPEGYGDPYSAQPGEI